ncbi:MAG: NAD-dependent epimerase/dehydratase family protein [Thermoleophilia bacterium]|nr:NAD-dependent epimerase/dehydratase family protein [Thermoleophilia bacterium]
MRYLVTGAAGFIGSSISDALLADGHEVVGIDCFTDYYDTAIKRRNVAGALEHVGYELHEFDLATTDIPDAALEVDGVFHQAAQAGVRASWGSEFATYTQCNVLATQRVLEQVVRASERHGRGRPTPVVYASSSSVYGNAEQRPTVETALPAPISPYGVTKLAAEHLVDTYRHEFGVPGTSLRYFTVYGPRQRPDMAFNKFIRSALAGTPIGVFGDGNQSRDFTFITDIVAGNRAAMHALTAGTNMGGTYNLGGGSTVTVREIVDMLADILGRAVAAEYGDTQKGDVRHTSADTSAARAAIGFDPKVDLRTGLAREVEWMQALISD